MFKKFNGILLIFISLHHFSFAQGFQVMMQLNKLQQHDSLGYNIVKIFPALLYSQIMQGKIKLWDSPKKETLISASALQSIEKATETEFCNTFQFFIYELWNTYNADSVNAQTIGFSFVNINKKYEAVMYGFVEVQEVAELFKTEKIPVNANGAYDMTYEEVFGCKRFNYNFVQYGDKKISSQKESAQIKQILGNIRFTTCSPSSPEYKRIHYTIEISDNIFGQAVQNSRMLFDALEHYFSKNEEDFLNIGGDKVKASAHISKITAEALCYKNTGDGSIMFMPENIVIYMNDIALDMLKIEDIRGWEIMINFMSLEDFLKQNECFYSVQQINTQRFETAEITKYTEAFQKAEWNRITEFVRQKKQ